MNVTSSGIINGLIQPQYGRHGTQFNENGIPTFSLPFIVENAPQETVSLAIVLEDKDAYPVTGGFAWIHWLAANITRFEIKENEDTDIVYLLKDGTLFFLYRRRDFEKLTDRKYEYLKGVNGHSEMACM